MSKRVAIAAMLLALPVQGARALPIDCTPCPIKTTPYGYIAPVTTIASGMSVAWLPPSDDSSHTAQDKASNQDYCFNVGIGYGAPVVPVRFDIVGGSVIATTDPGSPYATSAPCSSAIGLPGGVFAIPYFCSFHIQMHGTLIVH